MLDILLMVSVLCLGVSVAYLYTHQSTNNPLYLQKSKAWQLLFWFLFFVRLIIQEI